MIQNSLIMISPHNWYDHVYPNRINRPLKIVEQFCNKKLFGKIIVVNRLNPRKLFKAQTKERILIKRGLVYKLYYDQENNIYYLEHCFPFGIIEEIFLPIIIERVNKLLEIGNKVIWISDPKSVYLFKKIKGKKVFDAYDDWSLSPLFLERKRHFKYIIKGYETAKKLAELIIANTEYMKRKFEESNGEVFVIGNTSSLKTNNKIIEDRYGDLVNRKQIVGYIGNIHERIDLEILEELLSAFPKVTFEFIGKNEYKSKGIDIILSKYRNIKLTGPVPYSEIPICISNFDACIVPHKVDNYTLSQDSMKIYDFLALGKPIVSTNIPPTDSLGNLVYIAKNPKEFTEQLKIALNENDNKLKDERIEFIERNSWGNKADYIYSLLNEV